MFSHVFKSKEWNLEKNEYIDEKDTIKKSKKYESCINWEGVEMGKHRVIVEVFQ